MVTVQAKMLQKPIQSQRDQESDRMKNIWFARAIELYGKAIPLLFAYP